MKSIRKLPESVQFFHRDEKVVAINPEVPSWVVTDGIGELILRLFDGDRSTSEIVDIAVAGLGIEKKDQVEKYCSSLIGTGIFSVAKAFKKHKYPLHMVHLSLSDTCNLKCIYCYAAERVESNFKKLNLDEYKTIIDEVLVRFPNCGFTITGGEPLLNPLWKDIAEYIKQKEAYSLLLTNGTLISEENIEVIKNLFSLVTLSVDGSTSLIHSRSRGDNYERVMNAVDLLEKNSVEYSLSMTVSKLNIDDVEPMAHKYGAKLKFAPLFPVSDKTKNGLTITGREYFEALKNASGVNPLAYCERLLNDSRQNQCHKCAVGDGEISISVTGDVYPCQLLHVNQFLGGNVHEKKIMDIYDNSLALARCSHLDVDSIEGCSTCAFRYICGGACRARSYYECDALDKTGDFCIYEKEAILDGMIQLYSKNLID